MLVNRISESAAERVAFSFYKALTHTHVYVQAVYYQRLMRSIIHFRAAPPIIFALQNGFLHDIQNIVSQTGEETRMLNSDNKTPNIISVNLFTREICGR